MQTHSYSDEELLSYIMGDCRPEFFNEIESKLDGDPLLKKDIQELQSICRGIKNMPVAGAERQTTANWLSTWSRTLALTAGALVLGLFIESEFKIFRYPGENETEAVHSGGNSRDFSWDETHWPF